MAYSKDLRKKVIVYLEDGHSQREAGKTFHINTETVNRWHQLYQKTGDVKDPSPRRTFKKLDPQKLRTYIEEHPDAYLKEIGAAFGCTDTSVAQALKKLNITRKKRAKGIGNRRPS